MRLVVSPHLDDAVLGYGGAMALSLVPTTIVTVLAGYPPPWSWPTPFDNRCGFADSRVAVHHRRTEDHQAAAALGATAMHLEFLDGQYGLPRNELLIGLRLRDLFNGADEIVVPLGLTHPDHRLVARVCQAILHDVHPRSIVVYADLPGAALEPSHVPGAMRGWERIGWRLDPIEWEVDVFTKRAAWECYVSQVQFPELAWQNLIEERGWRASTAV